MESPKYNRRKAGTLSLNLMEILSKITDIVLRPVFRCFCEKLLMHIIINIIRDKDNRVGSSIFMLEKKENYVTYHVKFDDMKEYDLLFDRETQDYYIINGYLVVLSGKFKESRKFEELLNLCLADFVSRQDFCNALEYAALGHWRKCESYVHENWLTALEGIPDGCLRDYVWTKK